MSTDKHVATRKNLSLSTATFGISAIGSVIGTVLKLIAGGGVIAPLAFLIVGSVYFWNSWTAFGKMEYGKSNRNALISAISGIISALFAFGFI